jgi:hypothetical protein
MNSRWAAEKRLIFFAKICYDDGNYCYFEGCNPMTNAPLKSQPVLYPLPKNGAWGYVDVKGNWVIAPQFDAACLFAGELALVKSKGKIQFINLSGALASKLIFEDSLGFWDGLAPVLVKTASSAFKWGVINTSFQYVIEPQHDFVGTLFEGVMRANSEGKWGYLRPDGKWALQPQYDWVGDFTDGLARVQTIGRGLDTRFVKPDFSFAFEGVFENAEDFCDGVASVFSKGRWGLVDSQGKILIDYQYHGVGDYREGWLPVQKTEHSWGFVNKANKPLTHHDFSAVGSFSEGLAPVAIGERWGFINAAGNIVIEPLFDNVQEFVHGLALFQRGPVVGYMDKQARVVSQSA